MPALFKPEELLDPIRTHRRKQSTEDGEFFLRSLGSLQSSFPHAEAPLWRIRPGEVFRSLPDILRSRGMALRGHLLRCCGSQFGFFLAPGPWPSIIAG